jgi:hypothetical protein
VFGRAVLGRAVLGRAVFGLSLGSNSHPQCDLPWLVDRSVYRTDPKRNRLAVEDGYGQKDTAGGETS